MFTKGKLRLNNYHHPHKYIVAEEGANDNDAFPGRRKICDINDWNTEKGRANAQELVRRWNAFEKDGVVDELRTACKRMMEYKETLEEDNGIKACQCIADYVCDYCFAKAVIDSVGD